MKLQKLKHYLFTPRWHFSRVQFNLVATFLIFAGLVAGSYLTMTELILPRIFALDDATYSWDFSTAGDYTYNSDLITISGGQASINSGNQFTNASFVSNNDSWSTAAVAPTGWVEIPANDTFGTNNFLMMKYEAKAYDTDNSSVIADGGYSSGAGWAGANDQTRYQAISTYEGRPWVYIAQEHSTNYDAQEACTNAYIQAGLPSGSTHLVNNNEWMTVARNATNVASNWTEKSVGSGQVFRGHTDNDPANSLAASSDDTQAWYGMTGSNYERDYNQRTLTLSNNQIIWDLSGNVWDWTDDIQSSAINTTAGWVEWNSGNVVAGAIDLYGPASGYLSAQGMGKIYGGALNNAFLRGARWSAAAAAGVFAVSLTATPASQYILLGFGAPVIA